MKIALVHESPVARSRLYELTSLDRCKAYEATGADLLLCLVNPCEIPHDEVVRTIESMGQRVLPELA